jgi:hypothetical protein
MTPLLNWLGMESLLKSLLCSYAMISKRHLDRPRGAAEHEVKLTDSAAAA